MSIINKDKGSTIAQEFEHCKNVFQQLRGLMFSKRKCLLFELGKEKRTPLHMFFVFFAIDVIYLDKTKKVVEMKRNLKPFWFYYPEKKAKFIIEAPSGVIDESCTERGDQVVINISKIYK